MILCRRRPYPRFNRTRRCTSCMTNKCCSCANCFACSAYTPTPVYSPSFTNRSNICYRMAGNFCPRCSLSFIVFVLLHTLCCACAVLRNERQYDANQRTAQVLYTIFGLHETPIQTTQSHTKQYYLFKFHKTVIQQIRTICPTQHTLLFVHKIFHGV